MKLKIVNGRLILPKSVRNKHSIFEASIIKNKKRAERLLSVPKNETRIRIPKDVIKELGIKISDTIELITRAPTEEVITMEDLKKLLETKDIITAYDGFEPSGN